MVRTDKDPLVPLEAGVHVAWSLLILCLAIVPLAIWGTGSVGGVGRGDPAVCVQTAPGQGLAYGGGDGADGAQDGPLGLRAGVTSSPSEIRICDPEPDVTTQVLEGVRGLTPFVAALGFFWWFRRVLRRASREGVFSDWLPRSISVLGRYLVLWGVGQALLEGFVDAALLRRMAESATWYLPSFVPWAHLLCGLGLLTVGRVMARAVEMRRDVEATI